CALVGAAASNRSTSNGVTIRMSFRIAARGIGTLTVLAIVTLASVLTARVAAAAEVTFCCTADNDLFKLVPSARRFDSPVEAVDRAGDGSAVLILADGYPQHRTDVPAEVFDRARAKNLHLYVEYPAAAPGLKLGEMRVASWERGVIMSDAF